MEQSNPPQMIRHHPMVPLEGVLWDLEYLLRTSRLSKAEVAAKACVSVSAINKWLSGARAPKVAELARVFEVLGHRLTATPISQGGTL